ncbi:hypothetical protein OG317_24965 [Streptomyces sp. NBC_01167]|uniref:Uncharacterized protein n=1 Tax=Streptomyces achmelvichensis TaxID=3134111 RepID=A0ACC6Q146_9ACTN|nr:hypothetical protein OG317_24965 [Streptomyces sp. NBC_01167]
MGSEGRRTVRSPQTEHQCPACGQPVGTVTKRRKTLGAYVPFWGPGPCHNPDCAQSAESGGERPGDRPAGRSTPPEVPRPGP